MVKPSTNGSNGRDEHGRFLPGHPGGPGNPHAKQVGKLRSAMLAAVSDKEMKAVVKKLVELAKSGNVPAAREVLDRCLGRSPDERGMDAELRFHGYGVRAVAREVKA